MMVLMIGVQSGDKYLIFMMFWRTPCPPSFLASAAAALRGVILKRAMAKPSVAYAKMRKALLAAVRRIPKGRVVEAKRLAESLNIPARHVVYMLAQLAPDEKELVPWHRVAPTGGDFGKPNGRTKRHIEQLKLLADEGLLLADGRRLALSADRLWQTEETHCNTIWADEP